MADGESGVPTIQMVCGADILWAARNLKPTPLFGPRDLPKFGGFILGAWLLRNCDIVRKVQQRRSDLETQLMDTDDA
eukprot:7113654-Alexandrium_andersonii.AAC.1